MKKDKNLSRPQQTDSVGSRTLWQEAWLRFKRNRSAMLGALFILILLVISVATMVMDAADGGTFYQKMVIKQNLRAKLAPPSAAHIFGCDEYGRDVFFRMLWGTRYSLFIGVCAIAIAMLAGGFFGAIAGFYGGRMDNVIMRVMDVFLAIPSMVLAIAVVAALGTSMFNLLLSIAVPQIPRFARVVRAAVMGVRDKEFIEASRAVGAGDGTIILRYILPNAIAPIIARLFMTFSRILGGAVVIESVFAYPGLGLLLRDAALARDYPMLQGLYVIISGLVILMNFLADMIYAGIDRRVKV